MSFRECVLQRKPPPFFFSPTQTHTNARASTHSPQSCCSCISSPSPPLLPSSPPSFLPLFPPPHAPHMRVGSSCRSLNHLQQNDSHGGVFVLVKFKSGCVCGVGCPGKVAARAPCACRAPAGEPRLVFPFAFPTKLPYATHFNRECQPEGAPEGAPGGGVTGA